MATTSPGESALMNDDSSRGRILRAAIHQVSECGADNISARSIIDDAKVSRTTLYQYFGDVTGILAELWTAEGSTWLRRLADSSIESASDSGELQTALVEILAVARRYPEINEVVLRDTEEVWSDIRQLPYGAQLRTMWTLAGRLGHLLSQPVRNQYTTTQLITSLICKMPDNAAQQVGIAKPHAIRQKTSSHAQLIPHDVDAVTANLVRATVSVVANAGLANTSALRVCRVARVTTGSLQSRFPKLSDLVEAGFAHATDEIVRQNTEATEFSSDDSPADANAQVIPNALSAERTEWRHFKQELHLVARRDRDILRMLRRSYDSANAVLHQQIVAAGLSSSVADAAVEFNEVYSLGLALLHDLKIPVADFDHRIVMRWLFRSFT